MKIDLRELGRRPEVTPELRQFCAWLRTSPGDNFPDRMAAKLLILEEAGLTHFGGLALPLRHLRLRGELRRRAARSADGYLPLDGLGARWRTVPHPMPRPEAQSMVLAYVERLWTERLGMTRRGARG